MSIKNRMKGWLNDWFGEKVTIDMVTQRDSPRNMPLYYKELAISVASSLIASAISKCEINIYKNHEKIKDEEYFLFNYSPNQNQNSSQYTHQLIEHLLRDGEALVIENAGSLYVADAWNVTRYAFLDDLFTQVTVKDYTFGKTFKASDVLYYKLENEDIRNLLDGIYDSWGSVMSEAINGYMNMNGGKYTIGISTVARNDPQFKETFNDLIQNKLKSFFESKNAVYPQYDGFELNEIKAGNAVKDSSDFRNLKKDMFEIVAQAYKIPIQLMLGDVADISEITRNFITFAVRPITEMMDEENTRKRLTVEQFLNGYYYETNTNGILYKDILDMAQAIEKLVSSGVYCIDEVREKLGDKPLNTEFSQKHYISKNYADIEGYLHELTKEGGGIEE